MQVVFSVTGTRLSQNTNHYYMFSPYII